MRAVTSSGLGDSAFRTPNSHSAGSIAEALKLLDEEVPSSLAQSDVVVRASLARALAFQIHSSWILPIKSYKKLASLPQP